VDWEIMMPYGSTRIAGPTTRVVGSCATKPASWTSSLEIAST
jgi:hypothetical protein